MEISNVWIYSTSSVERKTELQIKYILLDILFNSETLTTFQFWERPFTFIFIISYLYLLFSLPLLLSFVIWVGKIERYTRRTIKSTTGQNFARNEFLCLPACKFSMKYSSKKREARGTSERGRSSTLETFDRQIFIIYVSVNRRRRGSTCTWILNDC